MDSARQSDEASGPFEWSDETGKKLSAEEGLEYLCRLLQDADSESLSELPIGIRAILQTALKYPSANVTDPVVAEELVASMLEDHWGALKPPPEHAAAMHHSISMALLEDPISSERLVRLWGQLVERTDGRINDN